MHFQWVSDDRWSQHVRISVNGFLIVGVISVKTTSQQDIAEGFQGATVHLNSNLFAYWTLFMSRRIGTGINLGGKKIICQS